MNTDKLFVGNPPSNDAEAKSENQSDSLARLEARLVGLEHFLERILSTVTAKVMVKDWYSTTELAQLLNRRPYTVREWCRLGRVNASRTHAGRREVEEWRVSHQELQRIQNEGLLPIKYR